LKTGSLEERMVFLRFCHFFPQWKNRIVVNVEIEFFDYLADRICIFALRLSSKLTERQFWPEEMLEIENMDKRMNLSKLSENWEAWEINVAMKLNGWICQFLEWNTRMKHFAKFRLWIKIT
jgi:hypothetical protein